ncbi:hypothetical protein [Granulicella aggregans]|uniref:hypothetical protein n=1 Tax=Granulicella aggregans TaxID=474949 RepID=UPI0021E0B7AD|nr:hypothetical protein [Granulicella aggregans]
MSDVNSSNAGHVEQETEIDSYDPDQYQHYTEFESDWFKPDYSNKWVLKFLQFVSEDHLLQAAWDRIDQQRESQEDLVSLVWGAVKDGKRRPEEIEAAQLQADQLRRTLAKINRSVARATSELKTSETTYPGVLVYDSPGWPTQMGELGERLGECARLGLELEDHFKRNAHRGRRSDVSESFYVSVKGMRDRHPLTYEDIAGLLRAGYSAAGVAQEVDAKDVRERMLSGEQLFKLVHG